MALSRAAKIWLVVISIPLLILTAGIVTVKLLLTGERLKAFLVPRVEEATGRSVSIGDISLSFFPFLALEVDSIAVSNGMGFSAEPILSADRLVLDIRLMPLFSGRIEVPTITLVRPSVLLEFDENGVGNYETKKSGTVPDTGVGVTGGGFFLSEFQLKDGTVRYYDYGQDQSTVVSGLNLSMEIDIDPAMREARLAMEGTVDGLSYGSLKSELISDLRMTTRLKLLYRENDAQLLIEDGEISVEQIVLSVRGQVDDLNDAPRMNFVLESSSAGIPDLLSLAPKEYMKKAEGVEGTGTARIKVTISRTSGDPKSKEITGLVSATDATIRYPSLPRPITNVNIVADFTRSEWKQEFRVTDFSASLGKNPFSARMIVEDFENPVIDLAVHASLNLSEVKDYYPLDPGTELSGTMKADITVGGRVDRPDQMKSGGSLSFQGVMINTEGSSNPVHNMNGVITFNNQVVESKKLAMQIGKSDLNLAFWLKNYLALVGDDTGGLKPSANITVNSTHLYTIDLTGDESGPKGKKGAGKPGDPAVPLPNVDMDVSATIGTLTMEKFELKNVRTTMSIANGIVAIQNFSGNTYNGSIITSGTLDLRDPSNRPFDLVFDMNGLDAHEMLPNFTSFGNRLYGNLSMKTSMKGALDDTLGLIPAALNGGGSVQMRSGKVEGVQVNQLIAGMMNLPDLRMINFKDWENRFSITGGRIMLNDLKITAMKADYTVNGSIGLDGSLDYLMTILLPPDAVSGIKLPGVMAGFVGQAVDLFKDPSGKVRLDFNVRGTTDSPSVSLNTDAAKKKGEEMVKQKLDAEKKKLEEELKKKAEDLLKSIDPFKKKDGPE